jgi:hypothetical protein
MKKLLIFLASLILMYSSAAYAIYDTPDNNLDCPGNCRQIDWSAGSDQWNNGVLPIYTDVYCTEGLTEGNGTTDNVSAINSCLSKLSAGQAAVLPTGIYYINGTVTIPSNKVLRGAKSSTRPFLPGVDSTQTTLKFGSNGKIVFGSGGSKGTEKLINSGYTKNSQSLTLATGHGLVANDWIAVFEDGDSSIPTLNGGCTWCGENNGSNLIQQFTKVLTVSGDTITTSRPLYYTYSSTNNPGVKKITWGCQYGGLEYIRLDGSYADHSAFITMSYTLFCWLKGIETYDAGSAVKADHIILQWSHGAEIRDSYFHYGRNSSSDKNYGLAAFFWNSDHKIENNIFRNHRHSLSFEGGGEGCAILYNYVDDNYTDDLTYLGSTRINHGAHPMYNLYEGNIISHITADAVWGSSSHITLFRNWIWGDETGVGVPSYPPESGYVAFEIWQNQTYYSVVGNVLGMGTEINADWSAATLKPSDCNSGYNYPRPATPVIYCVDSTTSDASDLLHGNYDYKTLGVAYWDGGTDHALKDSMYYTSKPFWFSGVWPAFGLDVIGITTTIPAKIRYETGEISEPDETLIPGSPKNLIID